MPRLTQLEPTATPTRRYGSFSRVAPSAWPHPVGRITQLAPMALSGRRYGSFARIPAPVPVEAVPAAAPSRAGVGVILTRPRRLGHLVLEVTFGHRRLETKPARRTVTGALEATVAISAEVVRRPRRGELAALMVLDLL